MSGYLKAQGMMITCLGMFTTPLNRRWKIPVTIVSNVQYTRFPKCRIKRYRVLRAEMLWGGINERRLKRLRLKALRFTSFTIRPQSKSLQPAFLTACFYPAFRPPASRMKLQLVLQGTDLHGCTQIFHFFNF